MKRYIKNIYYTQMKMRKLGLMMAALAALMVFASCSDQETYADQKKKERAAISSYIVKKWNKGYRRKSVLRTRFYHRCVEKRIRVVPKLGRLYADYT